jgi:hypothetical protein
MYIEFRDMEEKEPLSFRIEGVNSEKDWRDFG